MTAIVGLFGIHARDPQQARLVLAAMRARGSECVELWQDDSAALGAVSDRWEIGAPAAARLAYDEDAVAVTDASLYYVTELRAALRALGRHDVPDAPAALVLAAYRAWGDRFLEHIEGDFALALWDRRARKLVAARDHTGARPLFFTSLGESIAVASRLDGLASLRTFDRTLDPLAIADDALFLRLNKPTTTAYRDASRLPAGHRLTWSPARMPLIERWWEVPIFLRGDGPPFAEAVEELRSLVVAAVRERAAHPAGSAIWLSGGYDSSTLFAASQIAASDGSVRPLHPISMSYPAGDPGCEDEIIKSSTGFWHVAPTWVHVDDVPSIGQPVEMARVRDEPFYHTYEPSNRALAVATRETGRRVAINGNGGDQFFSASVTRLADHFRAGRFVTLAREWREAGGGRDWRLFVRSVVIPNLPASLITVANWLRDSRITQHHLTRRLPAWTNRSFDQLATLEAINRAGLERRRGEGHAALEQSWFLRHVTGERVNAVYASTGLLDGIELRTPLFDSRVIRFAASRPLNECYARRENKRLLRGAFEGYLPKDVLGPRGARTGLPQRFLLRTAREHATWAAHECTKGMILADFQVIERKSFLEAAVKWSTQGGSDVEEAAAFVACAQVEGWLRARL